MPDPIHLSVINVDGIAVFAREAGLPAAIVKTMAIGPDRIVIDLVHRSGTAGFELRKRSSDVQPRFSVQDLVLLPRTADVPRPVSSALLDRLRHHTFAEWYSLIEGHASKQAPAAQTSDAPPPVHVPLRLDRFFKKADHRSDWFRFCYPERIFLDANARLPAGSLHVEHNTLECLHGNLTHAVTSSVRLFADAHRFSGGKRENVFMTTLAERDVLGGSTQQRLETLVSNTVASHRPKYVRLATTCLPDLVGDDPSAIMEDLAERYGVRFLWTSKTRPAELSLKELVRQQLGDIGFKVERDPRAIILAGVVSADGRKEMESLTASLGLRACGHLLPSLDLGSLSQVESARAVVLVNPTDWVGVDKSWFEPELPFFNAAPPIGEGATLAWLRQLGHWLGLPEIESAIADVACRFAALRASVQADASRVTVGFVGDGDDLRWMSATSQPLAQLGFRIQFLLYVEPGSDTAAAVSGLSHLASPAAPVRTFSTPQALDRELGRGVDVVFSHFNHDPRLMAHGIRSFHEGMVGLGVAGSASAAHKMLQLARARTPAAWRCWHSAWRS